MQPVRSLAFGLLAAAALATAHADEFSGGDRAQGAGASRARSEVIAELQAYRHAGVNPWSSSYDPIARFHGQRSRADVQAEYLQARGEVAAMDAEDSGSSQLAHRSATAAPLFVRLRRVL